MVKIVSLRQFPERFFIFCPVGLNIGKTMVPGKLQTDKVAAAYFVEHVEPVFGSVIEHFLVGIELCGYLHYMELYIR